MKIEKLAEQANFVKAEITQKSGKILFEPIIENGDIAKTIEYILNNPIKDTEEEIVIILGSFYIMAETRACLGFKDETDPFF
jgi:folylpolyglutamate synthase/dihydropteroate synthase